MKIKQKKQLKYPEQKAKCEQFISHFEDFSQNNEELEYSHLGQHKYRIMLQKIANGELNNFEVQIGHLEEFFLKEQERDMVKGFRKNTRRYVEIFSQIAEKLMPQRTKNPSPEEEIKYRFENILKQQRMHNIMERQGNEVFKDNELLPTETHKNYDVSLVNGNSAKNQIRAIHDLSASDMGCLVTIKAIVLRATEVKPELVVATYTCDVCGSQNYVVVFDGVHKPLDQCKSKKCKTNNVRGKLTFLPGHSKFRSYQEIKVQETPDQIQMGAIPKSMSIRLRGRHVNMASPGDVITVEGILFPHNKGGYQHQFDLFFSTHLMAMKIVREKKKYLEMALTEADRTQIQRIRSNTKEDVLFDKLAKSISPNIYGLESVKKSLLLQMAGGVTKQTHDRLKIRGQINIALIGDPGIAKSQLLKHISKIAPRGVYTTGKGSSGVGLTAAIVIDPNSKETSLEAGALVLADMGICCIDQFDKMDQYDRTAIHEVMEQQTVSIAKAGITTTLNARCAILAAANPLYGRYNKRQSPHKNINMPAALLSRFDLVFILLDKNDLKLDLQLAKHIGRVHQTGKSRDEDNLFTQKQVRNYVAMSKSFEPIISQSLANIIVDKYTKKRQSEAGNAKQGQSYTTTRSLLALVRMCQARAKLRFSNEVTQSDFKDCIELLDESQNSVIDSVQERKPKTDNLSVIYEMIKSMCIYSESKEASLLDVQERAIHKGFTKEEVRICLQHYGRLQVLMCEEGRIIVVQ